MPLNIPKPTRFVQAGYKPVEGGFEKKEEREETIRERAARQSQERREYLTFTASDYERWERNRKRVAAQNAQEEWKAVQGNFPLLVFETKKKMDDFDAPDMTYGDESRSTIESYGLMQPFKNEMRYSPSMGYDVVSEDQFVLPASEHFKRMRSLGNDVVLWRGFSTKGETKGVFFEMVDKFERNEGGYYSNQLLTNALKEHETTSKFHSALISCLGENLKNGTLPNDILRVSSQYMMSEKGARLPKFNSGLDSDDLTNGGVLSVHDIWSMRVYVEQLEYKGSQVRGVLKYEIQDHFGLDTNDIHHPVLFDGKLNKPYEQIEGFRSWYLLQHYNEYSYKPFITKMDFYL
ncbi:DUF3289 family protein [Aliivibrio fischeri]|uniref:DUF3289 family protein n=1 Tax=Aliivibrio fischeri TaxID=668 RepID=UPI001F2449D0|nr:DUF3289 family protein [Aliivibrio fischeri]